jgi:2-desacetyl-2-hydroxyethyl bacteriochlorophyllide A dehydrogenase
VSKARTLFFTAPKKIELRELSLPDPKENEMVVESICSAISAGTEMLVYRGQFPHGKDVHDNLSSELNYPLAYGYACVGRVIEVGKMVDASWVNKIVFAFQPHTSYFVADVNSVMIVPEEISPECACFLPNMETAVNLIQDGAPILGERVLVLGQGIIGLLATSLLHQYPLDMLVTADHFKLRRDSSLAIGITASLDSSSPNFDENGEQILKHGADLTLELSGSPFALNQAIRLTRFSGRVVIGSWYGEKQAEIDLGGVFHRSRIKLISSQVSTISPELSGRWDKSRRFKVAWDALKRVQPGKWITHHFPIEKASMAYELLDLHPEETIQVIIEYKI